MSDENLVEASGNITDIDAFFTKANNKTLEVFEDYFKNGYLKSLAGILIYVGEKKAKELLESLPGEIKNQVEKLFQDLKAAGAKSSDAEIMLDAASVLKKSGFYGEKMCEGIVDRLSLKAISVFDDNYERFYEQNPILTMHIEHFSFTINDLVLLDDRSIQKVLREVDQMVLAKALHNVSKEVEDKIFRNMSKRAANMLKEDIEFMGPIRYEDVEEAQYEIVSIVRKLESSGDICFAKINDGEAL